MVVFGITASAILASVHLYLYLRLVRDTTLNRRLRLLGKVLVLLLAVLLVSARFVYARLPPSFALPYATSSWLWMGLATYLLFTFLTVGFARRLLSAGRWAGRRLWPTAAPVEPIDPERRLFISRAVAGSALAVSSGVVGFGAYRAFSPPVITDFTVRLPSLPKALDGFRLVHLSDVHVGGILERRFVRDLVQRTNALRPDLVAITGDLVDGDVPTLGPAVGELRHLSSRYGTYFVTGNHDYYSGADVWSAALIGIGITPLRNRQVSIGDQGGSFDLIGCDDWSRRGLDGDDLDAATRGRDPSRASVLLAHQPTNVDQVAARGIGLQLSGHTHGGQFFPVTTVSDLIWKFLAGHYTEGGSQIIVSRGTGFWGPPIRVGTSSEIIRITLLS
jgi:predicted MPP superfamily phosphohydrolase